MDKIILTPHSSSFDFNIETNRQQAVRKVLMNSRKLKKSDSLFEKFQFSKKLRLNPSLLTLFSNRKTQLDNSYFNYCKENS